MSEASLVDYYLRISNLEVFVALGKIQQLLDDPIFKNGVGSEINSVIPENTSSARIKLCVLEQSTFRFQNLEIFQSPDIVLYIIQYLDSIVKADLEHIVL